MIANSALLNFSVVLMQDPHLHDRCFNDRTFQRNPENGKNEEVLLSAKIRAFMKTSKAQKSVADSSLPPAVFWPRTDTILFHMWNSLVLQNGRY